MVCTTEVSVRRIGTQNKTKITSHRVDTTEQSTFRKIFGGKIPDYILADLWISVSKLIQIFFI